MRSFAVLVALIAAAPAGAQQAGANTARVYDLHEVEVLPRPQNAAEFTAALQQGYPAHLREAGVGGTVQVAFVVRPDGQPADVRVVSTPDSSFSAPSAQAVSLLRFTPAQVGGRPVAVRVEQPITWRTEAAPAAAAPASEVVDSVLVYAAQDADAWPMPKNLPEFHAALRELYPTDLAAARPRAEVLVRFAIDLAGQPQHAQVVQSSDARFDAISLQALARLRFVPAQRNGAPVWVWMDLPVQWGQPASGSSAGRGNTTDTYELSTVEELPSLLNRAEFGQALARSYPPQLRNAGVSGMVQVRFRVERNGTVSDPVVTYATNHDFDAATLRAVRSMRFRPARVNGRPVRAWVEQPINWTVAGRGRGPGPEGPEGRILRLPDRPMFGTPPATPGRRPAPADLVVNPVGNTSTPPP